MFITFTPSDGDAQEWEFDISKVRSNECILIEKRYGESWARFCMDILQGPFGSSMLARRVLLWHLIRLTHHTLKFEDTPDFYAGELELVQSREDLEMVKSLASRALSGTDKDDALAIFDELMKNAPDGGGGGKAPSKKSSPATG